MKPKTRLLAGPQQRKPQRLVPNQNRKAQRPNRAAPNRSLEKSKRVSEEEFSICWKMSNCPTAWSSMFRSTSGQSPSLNQLVAHRSSCSNFYRAFEILPPKQDDSDHQLFLARDMRVISIGQIQNSLQESHVGQANHESPEFTVFPTVFWTSATMEGDSSQPFNLGWI